MLLVGGVKVAGAWARCSGPASAIELIVATLETTRQRGKFGDAKPISWYALQASS